MLKKMLDRMFRKVDNVVYDMTTNTIGVKKDGSVFTVSKSGNTYELSENLFENFSTPIPAFAKSVPIANVKLGDLVLNQSGEPFGWVTKVSEKSLGVLKLNGTQSTVVPSKVGLLGQGQTIMVVTSMIGENGQMDPMMMLALTESDGVDSENLLPLLMSQGQGNNQNNMLPMLMMMGNKEGGKSSDMLKNMMLMQMMQQPQQTGDQSSNMFSNMNPMMMVALLGKL